MHISQTPNDPLTIILSFLLQTFFFAILFIVVVNQMPFTGHQIVGRIRGVPEQIPLSHKICVVGVWLDKCDADVQAIRQVADQ
jgi:hypothetical protein